MDDGLKGCKLYLDEPLLKNLRARAKQRHMRVSTFLRQHLQESLRGLAHAKFPDGKPDYRKSYPEVPIEGEPGYYDWLLEKDKPGYNGAK